MRHLWDIQEEIFHGQVEYACLKLRREVWTKVTDLEVTSIYMVFKSMEREIAPEKNVQL